MALAADSGTTIDIGANVAVSVSNPDNKTLTLTGADITNGAVISANLGKLYIENNISLKAGETVTLKADFNNDLWVSSGYDWDISCGCLYLNGDLTGSGTIKVTGLETDGKIVINGDTSDFTKNGGEFFLLNNEIRSQDNLLPSALVL